MADTPINKTQAILYGGLNAYKAVLRSTASNMANAETAGYVPEITSFQSFFDRAQNIHVIKATSDRRPQLMEQVYDPEHPKADKDGYISMPKINPLMMLVDMQESTESMKRLLRFIESTNDIKKKMIQMMGT